MTIYSLDILLSQFATVHCSVSRSNCCFLTCIQISQEASKMVWYSHLLKNFPQFVVIHTVKALAESMKQKQMFFWNSLAFSMIQRILAILSLVPQRSNSERDVKLSRIIWYVKLHGKHCQIVINLLRLYCMGKY